MTLKRRLSKLEQAADRQLPEGDEPVVRFYLPYNGRCQPPGVYRSGDAEVIIYLPEGADRDSPRPP